jgi:purine nucleoside phosphorylase
VRVCNMANLKVGIIGGTGLDDPDILSERAEKHVNTPFGKVKKLTFCSVPDLFYSPLTVSSQGRSREHHVFCCQGYHVFSQHLEKSTILEST